MSKFHIDKDPVKPTDKPVNDVNRRLAGILQNTVNELKHISDALPELAVSNDTSTMEYLETINNARTTQFDDDMYSDLSDREDGDFHQGVEYNGKRLTIGRTSSRTTGEVSGERAAIRVTEALGLGSVIRIPLWKSGIWVTLKAPSDDRLSETERRISQNKVFLGRETYGNVFANSMVYTIREVINLILDQIYHVNVKVSNNRKLLSLIKLTDLHHLVQGFLCSIYPKGYPYGQACTGNPLECNHVEEGIVNLAHMVWTDRSRLTDKQLAFMSSPDKMHKVDDIKEYQEQHVYDARSTFEHGDVTIQFKEPSIEDFILVGDDWISSIMKSTDRIFDHDANDNSRTNYIYDQVRIRKLGKWSHWVGEIRIKDDDFDDESVTIITDRSSINEIVSRTLSSIVDIHDDFTKSVLDFITDSTTTVVGVPRYKCPSCDAEPKVHEKYKEIIPINPVTAFFILLDQKLSIIAKMK